MAETYYLTKQGLEKLKKESEQLLELRRLKTQEAEVPSSLHSEEVNPDYLAFQEDAALLERRIEEMENVLRNAKLIKSPPKEKRNEVWLGATVTVDLGGEIDEFTIVGTLEADPLRKRISNESPLGSCLLGAKAGETVPIKTALVSYECRILKIVYNHKGTL